MSNKPISLTKRPKGGCLVYLILVGGLSAPLLGYIGATGWVLVT